MALMLSLSGCAPKEPTPLPNTIIKNKIYIPEVLTQKKDKPEIPIVNKILTKDDLTKIKNYIALLYTQNLEHESDKIQIRELINKFNGDSNESK
jgi:type IV pilus biogenesis protein CpaD/CtpE